MSDIAIKVEGLGKRYQLGWDSGKTLRDAIVDTVTAPARLFKRLTRPATPSAKELGAVFWALREVSFDVKEGEVIGLIGRNGAGKSTLLKILSRITEPTEGRADIHGRVGSLLEVGTGFHPELSGRENIYLNGALLGMRKAEIDRKFDAIVAFAEMEKFLDTPVKRYSSGMYTRLAFAVAAHLEPEILVVDEVLAVGDAAFQKKCLGKMGEVAKEGRTVLFVSHNMAAVQSLCTTAVLLEGGKIVDRGPTDKVVQSYLQTVMEIGSRPLNDRKDRKGDASVKLTQVMVAPDGEQNLIHTNSRLRLTLHYKSDRPLQFPRFFVTVCDTSNVPIYMFDNDTVGGLPEVMPAEGVVTCLTDPLPLTAGRCYVNVAVSKGGLLADYVEHAAFFDVESSDFYGTGKVPPREWALCVAAQQWSHSSL